MIHINQQVKRFVNQYNLYKNDTIQHTQLQHRMDLVKNFQVQKGMRILEVGCGQGDTTAVLADAVGDKGEVVAIDIASPDYGAPMTLGQMTDKIMQSSLGNRIDFYLETDFLTFHSSESFDMIVFSHCSWYFKSDLQLIEYFHHAKSLSNNICFAEWELDFTELSQRSHFCAASILALYSQFVENEGNIQHVFGKNQIQNYLVRAGFEIELFSKVDAHFLQDGSWEVDFANSIRDEFKVAPSTIQALVSNYFEIMNTTGDVCSLDSFVIRASNLK